MLRSLSKIQRASFSSFERYLCNASRCQHRSISTIPSTPKAEVGISDPSGYCKNMVRKHDYESFLISQFYPKEMQDGYFALKAFSVELSMIQDNVSTSLIGKMRTQFWRDAVKNTADGRPPQHPIALALHEAMQRAHLPLYPFKRIIDAREEELDTPTHIALDSLTTHAESTSSNLLYLLLSLLDLPSSDLAHAASHLGIAQNLTILLRALPFHASKRRMIIPAEITARCRVSQEEVFRMGGAAKGIDDAVFEFARVANDQLATSRSMLEANGTGGKVPKSAMPVFLAGVPVASFLQRLEAVNFDVFHPSLQLKSWKLPWQIWRGYYKGSF